MSALAPSAAITAFERDPKRFQTLEKMLKKGQCRNVKPVQGDFLDIDPAGKEWKDVTRLSVKHRFQSLRCFEQTGGCLTVSLMYRLLDPSCSGSGIVNRLDYLVDNGQYLYLERPGRKSREGC